MQEPRFHPYFSFCYCISCYLLHVSFHGVLYRGMNIRSSSTKSFTHLYNWIKIKLVNRVRSKIKKLLPHPTLETNPKYPNKKQ